MIKQVDHVVNLVTMLRTDKIAREGASKSGNMKEITWDRKLEKQLKWKCWRPLWSQHGNTCIDKETEKETINFRERLSSSDNKLSENTWQKGTGNVQRLNEEWLAKRSWKHEEGKKNKHTLMRSVKRGLTKTAKSGKKIPEKRGRWRLIIERLDNWWCGPKP